jgi:hypothetical protein
LRRIVRWATYVENRADMVRHGTLLVGEDRYSAKLTAAQVLEIRELAALRSRDGEIAGRFGITATTVRDIRLSKTWTWLIGAEPPIVLGKSYGERGSNNRLGRGLIQIHSITTATRASAAI